MDFTPLCLGPINPKVQRRTTVGFELAQTVLFTSGIQHYAELPEVMKNQPPYVIALLKQIPSVWEDTKFIEGYPGKGAVLARRGGGKWYVAGINGEDSEKPLKLDLSALGKVGPGTLITDNAEGGFAESEFTPGATLTLRPHGGFVLVLEARP
jgi:hypothetical protein